MSSGQPQESRENGEKKVVADYFIVLAILLGKKKMYFLCYRYVY